MNSNKCLHTADKIVVVHAMTHRDYGSCSEESCRDKHRKLCMVSA